MDYCSKLERLADGSLQVVLYRGDLRVHLERARSPRSGRRRAYDLLCAAIDVELDQRRLDQDRQDRP